MFPTVWPPQIKLYMHGIMHEDKGHFWPFIISTPFFLGLWTWDNPFDSWLPKFCPSSCMQTNSVFSSLLEYGLTPMMSPFGRLNFYASDFKITYLRAKLDTGFWYSLQELCTRNRAQFLKRFAFSSVSSYGVATLAEFAQKVPRNSIKFRALSSLFT